MLNFLKNLFIKKSSPTEVETTSAEDEAVASQEPVQAEGFIEKFEEAPEQDDSNTESSLADKTVEPEKKTVTSKPKAVATKKKPATKKKAAATKDEAAVVKKKTAAATKKKTAVTKEKITDTKKKAVSTKKNAAEKDESVTIKKKTTATKDEPAVAKKKAATTKTVATKAKTPTTKKKVSPAKASTKASSDDIDVSSDEKIKLVKIQKSPVKKNQILESKRQSKKYSVSVTPQATGSFEYNEAKKIELYVLAGSKKEALDTLAAKLSGGEPSYEGTNASSGKWLDGNRYSLDITGFEKASKEA